MKNKKITIMVFLLFIALFFSFNAHAWYMPLDEVKEGMTGYGRTVFKGTEVESFPVEIKGIIQQGYDRQLILIKTGGEKIEEIGGVASGMSGSPVYLEDRIIGAIAYGWTLSDHRIALVTPIEAMQKIWDEKEYWAREEPDLSGYPGLQAIPVRTPLLASGLSGRAADMLQEAMDEYDIKVMSGPAARRDGEAVPLKPGSSVAVDLIRGDMGAAFVGTVTYRNANQILAFGHPIFHQGAVDFFMSDAYVHEIIPSLDFPFKLASSQELKGRIGQDRDAGIAGQVGEYPKLIPVNISVRDTDRELTNRASFQVVQHERLLNSLVGSAVLQILDETLDRIGMGTARATIDITGKPLPDHKLTRENLYFSNNDVAVATLFELQQLIYILTANPYQKIDIYNIRLQVEVEQKNTMAYVQKVELNDNPVYPGDEVTATVILRPYRDEFIRKEITFTIPEDMPPGPASIVISGGPPWQPPVPEEDEEMDYPYEDFQNLLQSYIERPRNNQLVVEIYPAYRYPRHYLEPEELEEEPEVEGEEPQPEETLPPEPEEVEMREIIDTEFYLDGIWSGEIEIQDPNDDSNEE